MKREYKMSNEEIKLVNANIKLMDKNKYLMLDIKTLIDYIKGNLLLEQQVNNIIKNYEETYIK